MNIRDIFYGIEPERYCPDCGRRITNDNDICVYCERESADEDCRDDDYLLGGKK